MNRRGSAILVVIFTAGIIAAGYVGISLWSAYRTPTFQNTPLGRLNVGTKDATLSESFRFQSGFVSGLCLLFPENIAMPDEFALHIAILDKRDRNVFDDVLTSTNGFQETNWFSPSNSLVARVGNGMHPRRDYLIRITVQQPSTVTNNALLLMQWGGN